MNEVKSFKSGEITQSTNYWEINSPKCKRDLIIKKIAVGMILLTNLALLGTAFYFITQYDLPIPSKALVTSPFIVGILMAMTQLKLPKLTKLGINRKTPRNLSNPLHMLGRGAAYLLFAPYKLALDACDWTQYHDRYVANKIMKDLFDETEADKTHRSFESLAEEYGKHFKNLAKYGFIPPDYKTNIPPDYKTNIPPFSCVNLLVFRRLYT